MKNKDSNAPPKPVERLFPFVLRSRTLLVGRDTLRRARGKLHFVLVTKDLSENSRTRILSDFAHYPVVQHYTTENLKKFFSIEGAKVIGFAKSNLAQSIYAELKEFRINKPPPKATASEPSSSKEIRQKASPVRTSRTQERRDGRGAEAKE